MRDLRELQIGGDEHFVRPTPTEAAFSSFQSRFGVKLPDDYIRFLRFSNGGYPKLDTIELTNQPGACRWTIHHFYYLDSDIDSLGCIWRATQEWRPILGKHALPIAEDAFGNLFYLDLSTTPASVNLCVHDDAFEIIELAHSFEAFIDCLKAAKE